MGEQPVLYPGNPGVLDPSLMTWLPGVGWFRMVREPLDAGIFLSERNGSRISCEGEYTSHICGAGVLKAPQGSPPAAKAKMMALVSC